MGTIEHEHEVMKGVHWGQPPGVPPFPSSVFPLDILREDAVLFL